MGALPFGSGRSWTPSCKDCFNAGTKNLVRASLSENAVLGGMLQASFTKSSTFCIKDGH